MKILLVGVGGFGKRWVQAITDVKSARFVGMVDTVAQNLKEARQISGLSASQCYKDLKQALKEQKPDILVCSTPPAFHKICLQEAAKAGVHFITEKPMSDTINDAKRMVDIADKAGIKFAVSQNYRYFPFNNKLSQLVNSGKYGKPGTVAISYFMGPNLRGFRQKMPYVLTIDMSVHHYDLIRFILNDDPVAVIGKSWNPKWSKNKGDSCANVMFEMKSGLLVNYLGSWTSYTAPNSSWSANWRVECDKGTLFMEENLVYAATKTKGSKRKVSLPGLKRSGTQELVLLDFMNAIRKDIAPPTSGHDNIKSLAMVFKSIESFKKGGARVKI